MACEGCPEPQLLPENGEAVALFLACQTQWQYAGMGRRTGLNYAGVQALLGLHGIADARDAFGRIQIMEHEMLIIDQAKREGGDGA